MSEHLYILRQRENGKLCTYISADGAPSAAYKKYIPESEYDSLLKERDGLREALKKVETHLNNGSISSNEALCRIRRDTEDGLKTFGGDADE